MSALKVISEVIRKSKYTVFIDLTKAFDMVSRSGLWLLLRKFGCTEKFMKILKSLHEGMLGKVNFGGEFSEPFL